MIRYDLNAVTHEAMSEHIEGGTDNVRVFAEQPDWVAAFQQTVDEAEVVYAVWKVADLKEPNIYGYALGIIKGVDWLEKHYSGRDAPVVEYQEFTMLFDSIEAAHDACQRYGDGRGKSDDC